MTSYAQQKRCPSCQEKVLRRAITCPTCGYEWQRSSKALPEAAERHALKLVSAKLMSDYNNSQASAVRAIVKQRFRISQPQFYSFMQNGAGGPKTLAAMAEFVGVTIDELLGGKLEPNSAARRKRSVDKYPERGRAVEGARVAGFSNKAIRFVESLEQQHDGASAAWWMSKIVEAEKAIDDGKAPYTDSAELDTPRQRSGQKRPRSK